MSEEIDEIRARIRNEELAPHACELFDALEDMLIHYSMGWEMDIVTERANNVLMNAQKHPTQPQEA